MQRSLHGRLEALERRAPSEDKIDTIIVSIVEPGPNGAVRPEPVAMCGNGGVWRLDREQGEEVEAFRQRAAKLCPRNDAGMAMLRELQE